MGYIHLVMLGFMTTGILAWFEHEKIINLNGKMAGSGIIIFFSGFLISEILLFSQILITYINLSVIPYQLVLFPAALLMLTGAALLFTSAFISSKK
jgi:heme/copper-type cytochrome/quinol oxidase subunit 3